MLVDGTLVHKRDKTAARKGQRSDLRLGQVAWPPPISDPYRHLFEGRRHVGRVQRQTGEAGVRVELSAHEVRTRVPNHLR